MPQPPEVAESFPALVAAWALGSTDAAAVGRDLATRLGIHRVILVEGVSDRAALLALAERCGRRLETEGISVIAMGGVTNIGRFLRVLGPEGLDVTLGGLCDAGEEGVFRRYLEAASIGSDLTRDRLESLGFYVCVRDLEDELIRALGPVGTQQLIADEGEGAIFRTFQNQPFQRGRTLEQQLHRFIGTLGGRKERYARAFVEHLELDAVPRPIERVLAVRP